MAEKLKPCPFCGSKDIQIIPCIKGDGYFVCCNSCECDSASKKLKKEAVEAWNRRTESEEK